MTVIQNCKFILHHLSEIEDEISKLAQLARDNQLDADFDPILAAMICEISESKD